MVVKDEIDEKCCNCGWINAGKVKHYPRAAIISCFIPLGVLLYCWINKNSPHTTDPFDDGRQIAINASSIVLAWFVVWVVVCFLLDKLQLDPEDDDPINEEEEDDLEKECERVELNSSDVASEDLKVDGSVDEEDFETFEGCCCSFTVNKVSWVRWSVRLSLLSVSLSFIIWVLNDNILLSKSLFSVLMTFSIMLFFVVVLLDLGLKRADQENIHKIKDYMTGPQRATCTLCWLASLVYLFVLGCEEDICDDFEYIIGYSLGPILLSGILLVYISRRRLQKLMEDDLVEATNPLLAPKLKEYTIKPQDPRIVEEV